MSWFPRVRYTGTLLQSSKREYCSIDLPQGLPLYHARYALEGVAGLPTDATERCSVMGSALLRLGCALHRYVLADLVKLTEAEQAWKTLAYWCDRVPFPGALAGVGRA